MSLYNFVYNLQRKNNKTKKNILVGLLAISFIVLMFFWILIFKSQLQKIDPSQSGSAKLLGDEEKIISPLAALVQGFKNLKTDASKSISEYKNSVLKNGATSQNIDSSQGQEIKNEKTRTVYELPIE